MPLSYAKFLLYGFIAIFLNACLFSENDPNKDLHESDDIIAGAILLEELKTTDAIKTYIQASFSSKAKESSLVNHSRLLSLNHILKGREECEFSSSPSRALDYLSVGKLYFGSNSFNFVEIPETENHLYAGQFESLKEGVYLIKANGAEQVAGFQAKLSYPEIMNSISVQGQKLESPPIKISTHDDLLVQWKRPQFENEYNLIFLYIVAKTEIGKYALECAVKEKDYYGEPSDMFDWTISKSNVSKLPVTTQATVFITRLNIVKQSEPLVLDLFGLRTQASSANIQ